MKVTCIFTYRLYGLVVDYFDPMEQGDNKIVVSTPSTPHPQPMREIEAEK